MQLAVICTERCFGEETFFVKTFLEYISQECFYAAPYLSQLLILASSTGEESQEVKEYINVDLRESGKTRVKLGHPEIQPMFVCLVQSNVSLSG